MSKTRVGLLIITGLALAAPASSAGDVPDSVGFNIHPIARELSETQIDAEFAAVKDLGGTVVRVDVPWHWIEGQGDVGPGSSAEYDEDHLPRLDYVMSRADSHEIQVLAVVSGTPGWASSCPKLLGICLDPQNEWRYGPNDIGDFGEFVADLTTWYPELKGIEVWNEANYGDSGSIAGSPGVAVWYHANLTKEAYLSRADSDIKIYAGALHQGPGTAQNDPDESSPRYWENWLNSMWPTIEGYFDVWAVHDYTPGLALTAANATALDALSGNDHIPISIDEFGHQAAAGDSMEEPIQADELEADFIAAGAAHDVVEAIQYELRDWSSDTGAFNINWGVLGPNMTEKLSYQTIKALLNP